jgi:hypothetical protein
MESGRLLVMLEDEV